ncbi:MAG: hypothetical protein JSU81_10650 [Candidatus Coatesbacteria bacterium]|nr:MAG: hypothetical protein JSU81_10650 [Candidatus Coatesbacteria bacterium]
MRKVLLTFAAGLALASGAFATGHTVYIFNGTSGSIYPWYSSNDGMRCQMLFDRAKINYAGTITEFELEKHAYVGEYGTVKFYLCHTPLAALTTDFNGNYGGNTPKLVASFATYRLPEVEGVYPIPMADSFAYNNRDNLLLEVTWELGKNQKVSLVSGTVTAHVCYAYDARATTGTVADVGLNARVHFDTGPAVTPASFGRVKALYQ